MGEIAKSGPFTLHVEDQPDPKAGGACHEYSVHATIGGAEGVVGQVRFQHGPLLEVGPNGIPDVLLGEVLRHRLEAFQAGPFASKYNERALAGILEFLAANADRTADRESRGVEGKNKA